MKNSYLFILIFVLLTYPLTLKAMSEQELREDFFKVVYDWSKAESLLKKIQNEKKTSALFLAYEGSCEVIFSNSHSGFFARLEYVRNGLKKLDCAVALFPKNLEIRFLRFSIQYNVPGILGMSDDMEEDKIFIIKNSSQAVLGNFTSDQLDYIVNFMKESGKCSKEEISELTRIVYGK